MPLPYPKNEGTLVESEGALNQTGILHIKTDLFTAKKDIHSLEISVFMSKKDMV